LVFILQIATIFLASLRLAAFIVGLCNGRILISTTKLYAKSKPTFGPKDGND